MARRNRDLAGLAALGALGYMATRGKDVPVEDRRGTPVTRDVDRPDDRDIGMISGASPSGLYRNTESGDIFSMNRPEAAPARPAAATNRSMAGSKVPEETPSRGRRELPARRNVAGDYTRKMGATAEEIEAYRNRPSATRSTDKRPDLSTPEGRKRAEQEQALERVTPEEMLIGGPGLKALHGAAKRLAAPRIAEYSPPLLSGPTARLTGPSRAELAAADRAARDAARRAETARENAARYNTEGPLGGEGFIMRKKGGMVKAKKMASGGFTSASKRADGIASRGKTKCKMY